MNFSSEKKNLNQWLMKHSIFENPFDCWKGGDRRAVYRVNSKLHFNGYDDDPEPPISR